MRKGVKLFKIFGIEVRLHYSWFFIFVILAWSLATSFFPHYFSGFSTQDYWVMSIIASLLLFVSVILHELSHSLVAKTRNIQVKSITLFFFGGVAGIEKEEMKPSSEFLMAIAGPLFSAVLGVIFFFIYRLNGNGMVEAITFYLYQINFILAIFNIVPAYPLDGGRAFRALLYAHYKDLKKATRIASKGGKFFASFLFVLGIFSLFQGSSGGLWFILLGGFLYFLAGASYQQVLIKDYLSAIPLHNLMKKADNILSGKMSFAQFLKKYSNLGEDTFIVKEEKYLGIFDLKKIQVLPQKMHALVKLKQLSLPLNNSLTLSLKDNTFTAFRKINEQDLDFLPVLEKGKIIGVVPRKVIINRLNIESKFKSK